MKCTEDHCPTCGYDYDDPKFIEKHNNYDSPDPYRNTSDLLKQIEHSKWPIIDNSLQKQIEEHKSILDPDLLNESIQSFYKTMEANIIAQKLCGECLKPRPEDIEQLLKDGWNIVQKPMEPSMNNNTMCITFHMEQWWLCKKCLDSSLKQIKENL